MARREPQPETGNPLKYDHSFAGPLHKRSCTDVICLLLFVAFVVCWVGVGYYAYSHGDPSKLLTPRDYLGRECGRDEGVKGKPNLFFFDLSKCADPSVLARGCSTPQICVEECPSEDFVIKLEKPKGNLPNIKKHLICMDDVNIKAISNIKQVEDYISKEKCAPWYLKSASIYGRCLPTIIDPSTCEICERAHLNASKIVQGSFTADGVSSVEEIGHMVVEDLSDSWPYILGMLAAAMVICLFYIVLMRWFAGIMVWISIIGVLVLLSFCIYASNEKYQSLRNSPSPSLEDKSARGRLKYLLALKGTWLAFIIIASTLLVIVVLMMLFLRKRIIVAIALIKEASKAVGSVMSTLVFPLVPWILQCAVIAYALTVALYLASSSEATFRVFANNSAAFCHCSPYKDGQICEPKKFETDCVTVLKNPACKDQADSCQFHRYETPSHVDYLQVYNVFGFFWGLFFISALGEMILAGTFATWYWTYNKSDIPFFTLTISMGRTFRYHLGTVAFGSLILAICRMIRVILEYIDHKLKKYDNTFVKCIMCCLRCCFWCLEKFIKFINRNAYIMCAVHGKNFCRSAKDAFNLLMRNVIRVFVLDKVSDFLLFLGKLMITAGMCAISFYLFHGDVDVKDESIRHLHYYVVPVIVVGIGTYFIASIFFGVYAMAVDTLFLCFLEDCERNDGSAEKPYYMSKSLMKILGKKKKV